MSRRESITSCETMQKTICTKISPNYKNKSINEHDSEWKRKEPTKKLKQRLQEMISIQELLEKIQM